MEEAASATNASAMPLLTLLSNFVSLFRLRTPEEMAMDYPGYIGGPCESPAEVYFASYNKILVDSEPRPHRARRRISCPRCGTKLRNPDNGKPTG
jgi:hypothetical protein